MRRLPTVCAAMLLASAAHGAPSTPQLPPETPVVAPAVTLPQATVVTLPTPQAEKAIEEPSPVKAAAKPTVAASDGPPLTPDVAGEEVKEEDDANKLTGFSFGDVPFSLMYSSEQIEAMRNVLSSVEGQADTPKTAKTDEKQPLVPFLNKVKNIQEPKPYPSFYLASVVYRNGSDWTVWLSGKRITPKTNEGELVVAAISPDIVKFEWRPDYMSALIQRQQQGRFTEVTKVKNRLTAAADTVVMNALEGFVSFTLRANQSFSVAYMSTFEGKMPPADPPSFDAKAAPAEPRKMDDEAKQLLNDLVGEGVALPPDGSAPPTETTPAIPIDPNALKALQSMIKSRMAPGEAQPAAAATEASGKTKP